MAVQNILSTTLKHWFTRPSTSIAERGTWRDTSVETMPHKHREGHHDSALGLYRSEAFPEDLSESTLTFR